MGGADQAPVPVVLHEPVVRVCRKRQGVQVQGVEGRHVQQPQSCVQRPQLREVEREHVVAHEVVRLGRHPVELEQLLLREWSPGAPGPAGLRVARGRRNYLPALFRYLDVEREAVAQRVRQ